MSAFSIVTWNESANTTKRKPSNTTTFDFQAINIGADVLPITQAGSGGSAKFDFGSKILGNAGAPSAATDLATKGYTDSAIATAVISGGSVKQAVLTSTQLSSTSGIKAAAIFYLTAVAGTGDTFILKSTTGTETFTFAASASSFTPATGVTALDSLTSLAARINTDSVHYSAVLEATALQEVNAGGACIVLIEKVTASGASTSRAYGVFASPTSAKLVAFNTLGEYNVSSAVAAGPITLPATDPTNTQFGFRATIAALTSGEIHYIQDVDVISSWDGSAAAWYTLSSGVIPVATSGAGGGTQGKLTADTNYGLSIAAGVLKLNVDSSLAFSGGNLTIALSGGTLDKTSGLKVADGGIGSTQINSSALGNGLTGGSGTALSVASADGISVSGAGVAVDYTSVMTNDNAGSVTAGQVVYETSADHFDLASCGVTGLYGKNVFVVAATIATTASGKVFVRDGALIGGFSGLTLGPVYVSATAGALTQSTSAFTAGQCAYQVGIAVSATQIVFRPFAVIEY